MELNKKGIKPTNFGSLDKVSEPEEVQYASAEMEGSLDRLDHRRPVKKKRKGPPKKEFKPKPKTDNPA